MGRVGFLCLNFQMQSLVWKLLFHSRIIHRSAGAVCLLSYILVMQCAAKSRRDTESATIRWIAPFCNFAYAPTYDLHTPLMGSIRVSGSRHVYSAYKWSKLCHIQYSIEMLLQSLSSRSFISDIENCTIPGLYLNHHMPRGYIRRSPIYVKPTS